MHVLKFEDVKEGAKEKMQEGKERAQDAASRAGDKAHGEWNFF